MYKFEISADSPQELREKMLEFANEIRDTVKQDETDEYVNEPIEEEIPTFVEPISFPKAVDEPVLETGGALVGAPRPTPEVDSKGVIYDPAIHSANRSLNTNGTWRLRRGVDKTKIQQTVAAPEPFVAPPPPVPTVAVEPVVFAAPPVAQVLTPVNNPPMPAAVDFSKPEPFLPPQAPTATPQYDAVPVPAGVRPAHTLATFKNNLPMIFAHLINEKKITQEYIEQLKAHFQVKEVWNIMGSEKQCLELYQSFGEYGFITRVD